MDTIPFGLLAALVGLCGGAVLGLAARLGDFCTLGALESAMYGGDQRRLRMWGVMLATAISACFLLDAAGQLDLGATPYLSVAWNPIASIVGGLVFGYGMALAGNCGFGALARFGGGDIRSLVIVVVIGIFAFMTLNGPLSPIRTVLFPLSEPEVTPGIAHFLERTTGIPRLGVALVVAVGLAAWALAHEPLRADRAKIAWAVAAGLAIASAFWGTYQLRLASLEEVNVLGHSFTVPIGRTILYLMTSSAGGIGFPIGSVVGVMAGALVGSLIRGLFQWEACDDPRELGRQVSGAALMGIGGVIALGCSIGQGASAFATLAWSAPVTLAAIMAGGALGLRQLVRGFQPE